jgi:hypothetical protein
MGEGFRERGDVQSGGARRVRDGGAAEEHSGSGGRA